MGSKFKYLVIVLSLFNFTAEAQKDMDFRNIDSLTYVYYKSGDWNNLIKLGTEAIDNSIDYKYLRERIGFALFSKGDYREARKHFEKALSYDSFDTFTLVYLYYTYLNTAQAEYAGYFLSKMPQELRKSLLVKSFQPVESIDFEYNFKFAASSLRSNPQYYHFGINSQLGFRLWLYQMFSSYKQSVTIHNQLLDEIVNNRQPEYFALLKFTISPHWILKSAYHYLNTTYGKTISYANLGFLGLSANYDRLDFGVDASVLYIEQSFVKQIGIQTGFTFPGSLNIYLASGLSLTSQQTKNRFIYNQKAGFKPFKKFWLEGNLTFGDISNYNDYDAMYVYNLIDPTTFRTGATLFYNAGKHLTIWANYSYERKEFNENNLYHYNQYSFLGGLKWKL
jgi:hypothetical protein